MRERTHRPTQVLIIGAGVSGLAVAHELEACGIAARIVERSAYIGESWRHRRPQLRLNTHRTISGLPGMAIPKAAGPFPSRDSVIDYLEDYANRISVPIDFGVDVTSLLRDGTCWHLGSSSGVYRAPHVVVATGRDRVPWIPDWPGAGKFRGELIHSADFGEIGRYHGKNVLVVGAGNSGTDVLNHLSRTETGNLWVSVRHGPVVFPTRLLGFPVQRFSPLLEKLPVSLVDRILNLTERLAFGKLTRWGLGKHPGGGASRLLKSGTAPAIDDGFVAALKAGRVEVLAEIKGFEGQTVRLADGSTVAPDIVIAATGYRTGLEPLLGHLDVLDDRGVPRTHGGEADRRHPGLWFAGMRPSLSGFFHHARPTGAEVAAAIAVWRDDGASGLRGVDVPAGRLDPAA